MKSPICHYDNVPEQMSAIAMPSRRRLPFNTKKSHHDLFCQRMISRSSQKKICQMGLDCYNLKAGKDPKKASQVVNEASEENSPTLSFVVETRGKKNNSEDKKFLHVEKTEFKAQGPQGTKMFRHKSIKRLCGYQW